MIIFMIERFDYYAIILIFLFIFIFIYFIYIYINNITNLNLLNQQINDVIINIYYIVK